MQVRWQPPLGVPQCRVPLPLRRPSKPPSPKGEGSLANQGTGKRDKQAIRVRNALGALLEEVEHEIGTSYEATVWQKLEDHTRKGYAGALYKCLRYSRINCYLSPHEALKGRMLQVATDGQYESLVKALLSGLRGH